MVFCNVDENGFAMVGVKVTILILIDGFLQFKILIFEQVLSKGHNPYFNRWFSAIPISEIIKQVKRQSQSLF